jgi:hypothetical protein
LIGQIDLLPEEIRRGRGCKTQLARRTLQQKVCGEAATLVSSKTVTLFLDPPFSLNN